MNCINHPSTPAIAQCTDCHAPLCQICAGSPSAALCPSCYTEQQLHHEFLHGRQKQNRKIMSRQCLILSIIAAAAGLMFILFTG